MQVLHMLLTHADYKTTVDGSTQIHLEHTHTFTITNRYRNSDRHPINGCLFLYIELKASYDPTHDFMDEFTRM